MSALLCLEKPPGFFEEQIHEEMKDERPEPHDPERFSLGIKTKGKEPEDQDSHRDEHVVGKHLVRLEGVK